MRTMIDRMPGAMMALGLLLLAASCSPAAGLHTSEAGEENSPAPWGGLEYRKAGAGPGRAQMIVVLLHGYGSRADDLVGLSSMLETGVPTSFVFPEGPLDLGSGRRAWNRPDGEGFESSRRQVLDLLAYLQSTYSQARLVVGGFSQGGNMAVNLLSEDLPHVDGFLLFSPGSILDHPPRQGEDLPPIFLSHGRSDRVLSFSGSEELLQLLQGAGYQVTWQPFPGGHTIPAAVVSAASNFLSRLPH